MARRIFPDDVDARATAAAGGALTSLAGSTVKVYTDSAATTLANITDINGVAISGSTLTINSDSELPAFKGPDSASSDVDTLYVRDSGGTGTITTVYARHVDRIQKIEAAFVSATNPRFGATADGATDDYSALNSLLTAAAGGVAILPVGNYKITQGLSVPANTTILAYGARIFNTTTALTLLTLASGVRIYGLEAQGSGNSSYDAASIGVSCSGASASSYVTDLVLEDCYIHGVGSYGIYGEWTDSLVVRGGRIWNVGYSGATFLSGLNITIDDVYIKDASPGTASNAYGVSFTRRGAEASLVTYPRSKNCRVINSLIQDVPLWEGLDTHGGDNITFANNQIINCKIGVAIGEATGAGGTATYAPRSCRAVGNLIDSTKTNGTAGIGINITGAPDVAASSLDPATGIVVAGNTIVGHGNETSATSGAIFARDTIGLVVADNTIVEPSPFGIILGTTNFGFTVTGNTSQDPWSNTVGVGECNSVRVNSTYNTGYIGGNSDRRASKSATYVLDGANGYGLRIVGTTGCAITVGPFRSGANTPYLDAGTGGTTNARAPLYTAASAAGAAGFRIPHGAAPTAPTDGDMWTTTSGLFVRINGVTKTVTLT